MTTKTGQPRKRAPGAGRKPGSNCFVVATIAQLQALNPNPDFKWYLSKKQLEMLGANDLLTGTVSELNEATSGQSAESAPVIKEIEFD